jgi:hypothetical protein
VRTREQEPRCVVAAASALRCDARLLPTCRDESAMGSPTVEEEGRRARASHVAVWGARVGIGRALGLTFSCGMAVTRRALSTSVSCLFLLRSFRSCRCCCAAVVRVRRPMAMAMAMGYTTARGRSGVTWFAPARRRGVPAFAFATGAFCW